MFCDVTGFDGLPTRATKVWPDPLGAPSEPAYPEATMVEMVSRRPRIALHSLRVKMSYANGSRFGFSLSKLVHRGRSTVSVVLPELRRRLRAFKVVMYN